MKLRQIVEENLQEEMPRMSKSDFLKRISEFRTIGEEISKLSNYQESIQKIQEVCQNAETFIMSEQDDWFDNVTVKKNMQELGGYYKSFEKTATEAKQVQERLLGVYEQMGFVLNRYFNINEATMNEESGYGRCYSCGKEYSEKSYANGECEHCGEPVEDESLIPETSEKTDCPRCKGRKCSACGNTGSYQGYKKEIELNKKNPYRQNRLANKNNAHSDRMEEYGGPDPSWDDEDEDDELSKFNDVPKSDICGKCNQSRPFDKNVKVGLACQQCMSKGK